MRRIWRWLCGPSETERLLLAICERLDRMATKQDQLTQLISDLNDATNAEAARLDKLIADLAAAKASGDTITDDQLAQLTALRDRQRALGADPANPVPEA